MKNMTTTLLVATASLVVAHRAAGTDCSPHPDAVQWSVKSGGNGHYYARIREGLTWEQARVRAEELGGHLATLTTPEENAFAIPLVIDGNFNVSHIGGVMSPTGWSWITGEPWSYANWYPGEPNNATGDEWYLATWITPGTWNDVFPSYVAEFLVEWPDDSVADCNGNDVCDLDEIAKSPGLDLNDDGVIDGCQCIADVVIDGEVNGVDLARILNDWGTAGSAADIDRDGLVGGTDLAIVLSGWGSCSP